MRSRQSDRIRSTQVSGLTLALTVPDGLVRDGFSAPWRAGRAASIGPQLDLGVRLTWPAPEPGPLDVVRRIGAHGRIAVRFSASGIVIAEFVRSRAIRVVRMDGRLRDGVVECAPEVLSERRVDPLGLLGPILAHHRLAREGAASLLGCVVGTPAGTLVFASPSSEVRSRLASRLERGDPGWLAHGGFVVEHRDGAPMISPTPWTRVWSRRPGSGRRIVAWHAAQLAPALLAEPLRGRRASEALAEASALLPGDAEGSERERGVLDRIVEGERTVRLGFPDDDRLLRYAYGGSGAAAAGVPSRPRSFRR